LQDRRSLRTDLSLRRNGKRELQIEVANGKQVKNNFSVRDVAGHLFALCNGHATFSPIADGEHVGEQ
jgi:hypothetical protein